VLSHNHHSASTGTPRHTKTSTQKKKNTLKMKTQLLKHTMRIAAVRLEWRGGAHDSFGAKAPRRSARASALVRLARVQPHSTSAQARVEQRYFLIEEATICLFVSELLPIVSELDIA